MSRKEERLVKVAEHFAQGSGYGEGLGPAIRALVYGYKSR